MVKKYNCNFSGNKFAKDQLYRFVYSNEYGLFFDPNFKLEGDVYYFSKQLELKQWLNELFLEKIKDKTILLKHIKYDIIKYFKSNILRYIALAKKSGKLLVGKQNVKDKLKELNSPLIIQSSDSSERERFKPNNSYLIYQEFSSKDLSNIIGEENINYLMIYDDIKNEIIDNINEINKFENLVVDDRRK